MVTLYRHTVDVDTVTINALPPAWPEHLAKFERWVQHAIEHEDAVVGFDVETTAIDEVLGAFNPDARLRTVQFGSRRYGWMLDAHDPVWRGVIDKTLRDERLRFASHTNYDSLWAAREFGIELGERSIDTLPMAALLYPGNRAPKDLKSLCSKLVDPCLQAAEDALIARFRELAPKLPIANGQLRKPVGRALKSWGFTNIPLDDPAFCSYGGLDAVCERRLLDKLNAMIRRAGMAKLSRREQRIARMATDIRRRGHRVDPEWTRALLDDIEGEYTEAEQRLEEAFEHKFTPRSPQVGDWLLDRGVQFVKFTPSGRPQITMPSAASDGTLPELVERYADDETVGPVFRDLLVLGQRKNLLTNLRIILAAARNDGYVHPEIRTQAAHTGRMSVVKPAMQTFKKRDPRLRGCFIARDGHLLVGADYDSQEIRIALAFSGDPLLRRIISDGLNQHAETAKTMFGSKYVDKTTVMNELTGKTFYDAAKTLDFAQQYGAGPRAIGPQLGYPNRYDPQRGELVAHPEAVKLWKAWRTAYAGLVAWSEKVGQLNYIRNPWGRVIPADKWRGYANGNYAIQSTGRDVLGDALVNLEDAGWGERIWLPVHDELILEVPEDEAEDALDVLRECMYAEVKGVPLTVSPEIIGTRWGVAKD